MAPALLFGHATSYLLWQATRPRIPPPLPRPMESYPHRHRPTLRPVLACRLTWRSHAAPLPPRRGSISFWPTALTVSKPSRIVLPGTNCLPQSSLLRLEHRQQMTAVSQHKVKASAWTEHARRRRNCTFSICIPVVGVSSCILNTCHAS